jgi:hypothetical protein
LIFKSNLILILLIPIYFAFNLFFWLDFFYFIPNCLILIFFFVEFSPYSYIAIPFILSFFLNWLFFSWQFHPLLFNFIKFSYHICCLFFYHAFKIRLKNWPSLCFGSRVGSNDWDYWGSSDFFIIQEVKMTLFW